MIVVNKKPVKSMGPGVVMTANDVFEESIGALAFGIVLVVLASALIRLPFAALEQGRPFYDRDFNTLLFCCIVTAIFFLFGLFYVKSHMSARRVRSL